MKSIELLSAEDVRPLRGLLFDLDDTVLTHGVLIREAYDAIWRMRDAGFRLIAVTGRPSSWGELLVRQWPLDAAVTENGVIALVKDGRLIERVDACSPDERRSRRMRLASLAARVQERLPEVRLADDVDGRLSDLAWDIGERVHLPARRIEELGNLLREAGARVTQSSVHMHASFDGGDKASGVVRLLSERFDEDSGAALRRYAFVGDSTNDAACFSAFHLTFGVANVRTYASKLSLPPRFLAHETMGKGFAEIVATILARREPSGAPSSGDAR